MYEVRFIKRNKEENEVYTYHNGEDALNHYKLFLDDDSCLYKNISVMDVDHSTILYFMNFNDDGSVNKTLFNGCYVKLNKKWCRPEEERFRYKVSNINEETERCLITMLNPKSILGSSEYVGIEMIDIV